MALGGYHGTLSHRPPLLPTHTLAEFMDFFSLLHSSQMVSRLGMQMTQRQCPWESAESPEEIPDGQCLGDWPAQVCCILGKREGEGRRSMGVGGGSCSFPNPVSQSLSPPFFLTASFDHCSNSAKKAFLLVDFSEGLNPNALRVLFCQYTGVQEKIS